MPSAIVCTNCGNTIHPGAGFCGGCGARVQTCGSCGSALLPGNQFCQSCGAPAPASTAVSNPTGGRTSYSPWDQVLERLRAATLGEFEIRRELGRGGMAAVYLAHEIALNRKVAIKVMAPGLLMGEGMVERFHQEAVTIANLTHPHIITIHAVRAMQDFHFFVMKFVRGRSLDSILREQGQLPIPLARAILFQVGSGLAYAHKHGVIHRDVKPGNILVDDEGTALVTDFGIAKVAEAPGMTRTGSLVGTPAFMSPEQCVSGPLSPKSDQYSLGIVAFEMLAGRPPFDGTSFSVMQAHIAEPLPSLAEVRPDCPPEIQTAIERMCAKDPADRWPGIPDALEAIGARPLPEHDPVRLRLAEIAAMLGETNEVEATKTPLSPIPSPPRPVTPFPVPPEVRRVSTAPTVSVPPGSATPVPATATPAPGTATPAPEAPAAGGRRRWVAAAGIVGVAAVAGVALVMGRSGGGGHVLRFENLPPAIGIGDTFTVGATFVDGSARGAGAAVWRSSNAAVFTVGDLSGKVEALRVGQAVLSAEISGVRDSMLLTVGPARVAAVGLGASRTLRPGERDTLIAAVRDVRGNLLTNRPVVWRSSRPEVARIDSLTGALVARAAGTTSVSALVEGVEGSVSVTVAPRAAAAAPPPPSVPAVRATGPAESQIRRAVSGYVASLKGGDAGRIRTLYRPASAVDRQNLDGLVKLMTTKEWRYEVRGHDIDGDPTIAGPVGKASFTVRFRWRDPSSGSRRDETARFEAEFAQTARGWEIATCRIAPSQGAGAGR